MKKARIVQHTGKLVEVGRPGEGEAVFYAHGSESLGTYLGKTKFHSRADCHLLLGRNPDKTVVVDWLPSVPSSQKCKVCNKVTFPAPTGEAPRDK